VPKKVYDLRGKQSNLARLIRFDKEAFVHMVAYRALIVFSVIYGVIMLLYFVIPGLGPLAKASTAIIWILFTPQLFETAKGASLVMTKGLAFGHLGKGYSFLMKKKYGRTGGYAKPTPYAVMLLWAAGFVAILLWWTI
jgi:hypothetical protein